MGSASPPGRCENRNRGVGGIVEHAVQKQQIPSADGFDGPIQGAGLEYEADVRT